MTAAVGYDEVDSAAVVDSETDWDGIVLEVEGHAVEDEDIDIGRSDSGGIYDFEID